MKKYVIIVLLLIILITHTACSQEDIYIDDAEDDTQLSIYVYSLYPCASALENTIVNYNKFEVEEGKEIEFTRFQINSIEDINAMYTQILNEMSLGGGPDIIAIDWLTDHFIDISKMAMNNAFADIDILIEKSETFDFSDYNKVMLDAGILNGKRVFIPISYGVEYLIGPEECFQFHNILIPNELTMDVYLDSLEEYHKYNSNGQATYWLDPSYLLAEFIEIGKPIEKTEQIERLFKLLKAENTRYIEYVEMKNISNSAIPNYYKQFTNKNSLFMQPINYGYNQFKRLHENYNIMNNMLEDSLIVFDNPVKEGNSIKAYTDAGFVININSKHKNEAFKFIEYTLSENVQLSSYMMKDLPVNNDAYKKEINYFTTGYLGFLDSMYAITDITEAPRQMQVDFIEYVESAQTCQYIGSLRYVYLNVIYETIEDYYNDKITFDEMIDEINNKLAIYYTE